MVHALLVGGVIVGDSTDVKFHKTGYGPWGIIIRSNGAIVLTSDTFFNFYEFHGFMMWAAWGVFGFIQLATNRYLKTQWRYVIWVHRIAGTLILIITWVAAMLALQKSSWEFEVGVHQVIGITILSLVTLIVLGGVFNRSRMQRFRWNTKKML
jgi:hypothetical protein